MTNTYKQKSHTMPYLVVVYKWPEMICDGLWQNASYYINRQEHELADGRARSSPLAKDGIVQSAQRWGMKALYIANNIVWESEINFWRPASTSTEYVNLAGKIYSTLQWNPFVSRLSTNNLLQKT